MHDLHLAKQLQDAAAETELAARAVQAAETADAADSALRGRTVTDAIDAIPWEVAPCSVYGLHVIGTFCPVHGLVQRD
jgi:hypothetical protein